MVQSDPLAGVPARGLARIMWAALLAGLRRRLVQAYTSVSVNLS